MKEYEYDTGDYLLRYRIGPEGIAITGYQGLSWAAEVPERIEGQPVTAVDRKAFLSKKNLREIRLPVSVQSIGDWAFAYCGNLERVALSRDCISLGKALFLDCGQLKCISGVSRSGKAMEGIPEAGLQGTGKIEAHGSIWGSGVREKDIRREDGMQGNRSLQEAWPRETGRLLAAAVTQLEAYYLLEPAAVGSPEWLRKWDARLEAVMNADDHEGYSKQVLCGEEDYGSTDLEAFLQAKRQKKVRLAMLRLLCDQGLSNRGRQRLADYLQTHTQGCVSEESWQVMLAEGESHPEYVQLFLQLGCVTEGNVAAMLRQMREDQPQMRAAFLRYQQEKLGYADFFAELSL